MKQRYSREFLIFIVMYLVFEIEKIIYILCFNCDFFSNKFHHYVTNVSRVANTWQLQVKNLKTQTTETFTFDAIMICNGLVEMKQILNFDSSDNQIVLIT